MNNNNKDLLELEVEYQKTQKQAPMLIELDLAGTSQRGVLTFGGLQN
jgi:hypothetical protein